jgi:hypothetical protein
MQYTEHVKYTALGIIIYEVYIKLHTFYQLHEFLFPKLHMLHVMYTTLTLHL